ncbi:DUF6998 domain-containing protein [Pseudovibrio ascidiaceicola]|uniref:DUF6998 domain-containing protein n=1 Tax=Pseudovibrio ascidiaceicola TaxID=285279 RepID=UPI003D367AE1
MSQVLSQTQIIRSLGQNLDMYEKEVHWGVSPGELNHLTSRIGELYAAMITRGQMALATNQPGYDVVSGEGENISVKTVTTSNHVTFRASTFEVAHRVMILRLIMEDGTVFIEELLDCPAEDVKHKGKNKDGNYSLSINGRNSRRGERQGKSGRSRSPTEEVQEQKEVVSATHGRHRILRYKDGVILVEANGQVQDPAQPILREIAKQIGVEILNSAGNLKNTRTLGYQIIKALT